MGLATEKHQIDWREQPQVSIRKAVEAALNVFPGSRRPRENAIPEAA